jgi:hypothetical protein
VERGRIDHDPLMPRAPLGRIQDALCDLYGIDVPHSVEDFLCDEDAVALVAGAEADRGEVLVIAEEPDALSLGLYVCDDALRALARAGDAWVDGRLEAMSLATEGVSHFVYVAYRVEQSRAVSELELELQAEVDKYAVAVTDSTFPGVLLARSRRVRGDLFDRAEFIDAADTERGERYRLAHRTAMRFTSKLEREFLERADREGWLRRLRAFYRENLQGKLSLAA